MMYLVLELFYLGKSGMKREKSGKFWRGRWQEWIFFCNLYQKPLRRKKLIHKIICLIYSSLAYQNFIYLLTNCFYILFSSLVFVPLLAFISFLLFSFFSYLRQSPRVLLRIFFLLANYFQCIAIPYDDKVAALR